MRLGLRSYTVRRATQGRASQRERYPDLPPRRLNSRASGNQAPGKPPYGASGMHITNPAWAEPGAKPARQLARPHERLLPYWNKGSLAVLTPKMRGSPETSS
jgi:hypothetical protein